MIERTVKGIGVLPLFKFRFMEFTFFGLGLFFFSFKKSFFYCANDEGNLECISNRYTIGWLHHHHPTTTTTTTTFICILLDAEWMNVISTNDKWCIPINQATSDYHYLPKYINSRTGISVYSTKATHLCVTEGLYFIVPRENIHSHYQTPFVQFYSITNWCMEDLKHLNIRK